MVKCRYLRRWVGVVLLTAPGWHALRAAEDAPQTAGPSAAAEAADEEREVIFEETIDTGFVFLEGEYLSPPYHVQATADGVTVNGRDWPMRQQRGGGFARGGNSGGNRGERSGRGGDRRGGFGGGPGWGGGRGPGWGGGPGPDFGGGGWGTDRVARRIAEDLEADGIVIAGSGHPPEFLLAATQQHDFFVSLFNRHAGPDGEQQPLLDESWRTNLERWSERTAGVTVTEELRDRAEPVIEFVRTTEAANFAEVRAFRRLHAWAYPLTVLGMVLGVLALGHLLKSFSRLEGGPEGGLPPEVLRATTVSIGLMVVLSLFDLTWTLLASQAGQMRELNPLGSRLITDPAMLIAFKFLATLVGCGILFALRRHYPARQACWWLCLVCTVLTFRWIMFNSMFVA